MKQTDSYMKKETTIIIKRKCNKEKIIWRWWWGPLQKGKARVSSAPYELINK